MEFIAIIGDRGSFKTCFMTRALYKDVENGDGVTANYRLKFPHRYRTFDQIRTEVAKTSDSYWPSFAGDVIALDELGVGADSYDFFSKDTARITELVAEVRKLSCIVYYTVQRFGMIAKRLRDQTDAFYVMTDIDKGKMTYPDGTPAKRHREVCSGIAKYWMVDSNYRIISKPQFFNGKPWYRYYDTDQFIRNKDAQESVDAMALDRVPA